MLGIVIVDYHSLEASLRFIREQCPRISRNYALALVLNGCTDPSEAETTLKVLPEGCRIAKVVAIADNAGYAKGNNAGVRALMDLCSPEYILFSNNDIVVETPFAGDLLSQKLSSIPDAGVIGPEIVGLDGRRQSPEPFLPFAKRHLLPYWGKLWMSREKLAAATLADYSEKAAEGFHFRVMGSFMMVRTEDFIRAGMFDEATFLYAEEAILSDRMAAIGRKVWFEPSVRVVHHHAATTSTLFSRRRIRRMRFESEAYWYATYRHAPKFQILLARITYLLKDIILR